MTPIGNRDRSFRLQLGFILLAGEGHDLDLVAIRVAQERSVVVRIVFRSYARRSLVRPAMGKTGLVTGSHSSALSCVEGEVRRRTAAGVGHPREHRHVDERQPGNEQDAGAEDDQHRVQPAEDRRLTEFLTSATILTAAVAGVQYVGPTVCGLDRKKVARVTDIREGIGDRWSGEDIAVTMLTHWSFSVFMGSSSLGTGPLRGAPTTDTASREIP